MPRDTKLLRQTCVGMPTIWPVLVGTLSANSFATAILESSGIKLAKSPNAYWDAYVVMCNLKIDVTSEGTQDQPTSVGACQKCGTYLYELSCIRTLVCTPQPSSLIKLVYKFINFICPLDKARQH